MGLYINRIAAFCSVLCDSLHSPLTSPLAARHFSQDWEKHCKADSKKVEWQKARHNIKHPNSPLQQPEDPEVVLMDEEEDDEFER